MFQILWRSIYIAVYDDLFFDVIDPSFSASNVRLKLHELIEISIYAIINNFLPSFMSGVTVTELKMENCFDN